MKHLWQVLLKRIAVLPRQEHEGPLIVQPQDFDAAVAVGPVVA